MTPEGAALPASQMPDEPLSRRSIPVMMDEQRIGDVWLQGPATPWDDLILERMAVAAASVHGRIRAAQSHTGLADPGRVQLLISTVAAEADRTRAARLLGFPLGQSVVPIALVATDDMGNRVADTQARLAASTNVRVVAAALTDTTGVLLIPSYADLADRPETDGVVAGSGPPASVEQLGRSWAAARRAARFAGLGSHWPRWISATEIGSIAIMADLPGADVLTEPDVVRIGVLASQQSTQTTLDLLSYFCQQGSLREAAKAVHMHHSSAAYRLNAVAEVLGFEIRTPGGRQRAGLALVLWQLHASVSI